MVTLDTVKKHVTHVLGKLGAAKAGGGGRASAPSAGSSGVRNGPGVAGRTGRGNCGCSAPAKPASCSPLNGVIVPPQPAGLAADQKRGAVPEARGHRRETMVPPFPTA